MTITFQRPVGAAADVRELEYISALHQTRLPQLRKEGTVSATDVLRFVRSRTGLEIGHGRAVDVVRGLGGGPVGEEALKRLLASRAKKRIRSEDELDEELIDRAKTGRVQSVMSGVGAGAQQLKKHLVRRRKEASTDDTERRENGDDSSLKDAGDIPSLSSNSPVTAEAEATTAKEDEDENVHLDKNGDDDMREEYLDLVQLTVILLMPTLARAGHDYIVQKDRANHEEPEPDGGSPNFQDKGPTATTTIDMIPSLESGPVRDMVKQQGAEAQRKFERKQIDKYRSLRPQPDGLIPDVLDMLLDPLINNNGDDDADEGFDESASKWKGGRPVLSAALVKRLLESQSEFERAADEELVAEMVAAASGDGEEGEEVLFDEDAFVRALTADTAKWQPGSEDRLTTVFFDVFDFESYEEMQTVKSSEQESSKVASRTSCQNESVCDEEEGEDDLELETGNATVESGTKTCHLSSAQDKPPTDTVDNSKYVLKRHPTAANIDFAVDSHRSTAFVVALWVFYITSVLTYVSLLQSITLVDGSDCTAEFGCQVAMTIWRWLSLAVVLTAFGYIIIVPISLGNNPTIRSTKMQMLSLFFVICYTMFPYWIAYKFRQDASEPYDEAEETATTFYFLGAIRICLILGCILFLISAIQLVSNLVPPAKIRQSARLTKWLVPQHVKGSANIKMAATRKVNDLLTHAHSLHPRKGQKHVENIRVRSNADEAMLNFVLRGESLVETGGFLWTWRRIRDKELFRKEGILIPTRLVIGQVGQLVFILFMGLFLFRGTELVADAADDARKDLLELESENIPDWVYDFVPTRNQVYYALYPGSSVAMLVMLLLWCIYVPSTVGTILKFRSGILPSLYDSSFSKYRIGADTVFFNVGNMIYAMIGASILFFVIVCVFLFLIIWPFTRGIMALVFAWVIGLTTTILIKTFMMKFFRTNFYSAFYRQRPFAANVSTLGLECWQIGLAGGILIGRLTQFLLASAFWIGRIDVPFLSDDVNMGGYRFDVVPTHFRKDVLAHEAHRHPYLERILTMYLMRLRHGEDFSSRAGAIWRLLFVHALMPWLKKYRIFSDQRFADAMEDYEEMMIEEMGLPAPVVDSAGVDERNVAGQIVGAVGAGVKDIAVTAATLLVDEFPEPSSEKDHVEVFKEGKKDK